MRLIGRFVALLIILLVIPSTACAFWWFNANRVAMDPNTYKSTLGETFAYSNVMLALFDGFTRDNSVPRQANAIIKNMPPDAWPTLSGKIFPPNVARSRIDSNIDTFFDWLNGRGQSPPDIILDFADIKKAIANNKTMSDALDQVVPRLPRCQQADAVQIDSFGPNDDFSKLPICNPSDGSSQQALKSQLLSGFQIIGARLPNNWNLADEIRNAINNPSNSDSSSPNRPRAFDLFQLEQFRSGIWLSVHLTVTLFLIPIALLFLIVIVTIRSVKSFFRWIGWALVMAGIFSLLPVIFLPGVNNGFGSSREQVGERLGTGGQALIIVISGMVQTLINSLTLSVLLQVAVLIVIGLIAVFISVLLPIPEEDGLLEDGSLAAQGG